MIPPQNIFNDIPDNLKNEFIETICTSQHLRIERIISKGHKSAPGFWYDQEDDEWLIVLHGEAKIEYESGEMQHLTAGSYTNIAAHVKHRVAWCSTTTETIWLAIHYQR